jgi:type VI secretion system protein ImpB
MSNGAQDSIKKRRPPRVHIGYGVEDKGATPKRELPFIINVMAGLSGQGAEDLPVVADRKFIEIKTNDNAAFDGHLADQNVRTSFQVSNPLGGKDSERRVDLHFRSMQDFNPRGVIDQDPFLSELDGLVQSLTKLSSRLQSKQEANTKLQGILQNSKLMEGMLKLLEQEEAGKKQE